ERRYAVANTDALCTNGPLSRATGHHSPRRFHDISALSIREVLNLIDLDAIACPRMPRTYGSRMLIIDKISYTMCIVLACLWSTFAEAETISIQAKSYIAPVNLLDPNQFDNDAQSCQAAMAAVVNCGTLLGENPPDGAKSSRNYRLWSEVLVDATCTGNKVA